MYFFMLSKLRRHNYKAVGMNGNDYYSMTDEKKLKIVATLTEEQKTVIRRDYLYSHLTSHASTVSSVEGGMLLAFSRQHLPEKTAQIEATYKDEYGKKNVRLDERIKGLKDAEKRVKADAKKQTADVGETAVKEAKNGKVAKKSATIKAEPKAVQTVPENTVAEQSQAKPIEVQAQDTPATVPAKTGSKAEQTPTKSPVSDKILIVGVPSKTAPKSASGAVAQG